MSDVLTFPRVIDLDPNGLPPEDKRARFLARQALLDYFNELREWQSLYYLEPSDADEAVDRIVSKYLQVVKREHPSQRGSKR